jgi:hypothetical protein
MKVQIVAPLTDGSRGIIYEHNIFIMQTSDVNVMKLFSSLKYTPDLGMEITLSCAISSVDFLSPQIDRLLAMAV